jgi:hypothetical protein
MAANPAAHESATAGTIVEGVVVYIRMAEMELARTRKEGNDGQVERWQGYLNVMIGAEVALGRQPGYAVVDRCSRYARSQECLLELSRPRIWLELMERAGKRHAIRQLWRLCADHPGHSREYDTTLGTRFA